MKFEFDTVTERRNTNSLKWDVADNELPMWVADMDFETAPCIRQAVRSKAEKGIFGYGIVPEAFFDAISDWWMKRHHFRFQKEWMMFCTGVVAAISSTVRKLTTPGETIVVQSPVYNIFYNSILNNGRNVLSNDLIYENGAYRIDFRDLEEKLAFPQTTLMILCNPHNPIGKLWSMQELQKIGELCAKYHVTVLSDEIHCDIVSPGKEYIPFAAASKLCESVSVTCVAASKAFNLAGLQSACIIVPDPFLRHKVWRAINTDEVAEPNAFAIEANIAAFTQGEPWLNALNEYLQQGKTLVYDYVREHLPELKIIASDATYLLWMDISFWSDDSQALCEHIRASTGLYLCAGSEYGKNGRCFVRMNIATQHSRILDGLHRLKAALDLIRPRSGTK